jgi:hypothetical protein
MNNMNEEWFGICAIANKRPPRTLLYPRMAYYVLSREAHNVNPFSEGALYHVDNAFFKYILNGHVLRVRSDKAALGGGGSGERLVLVI